LASAEPTTPLGLDPAPTVQRFTLAATDRVLLYTDGLMEARAPGGRPFELDGQVEAVVAASSLGAALDGLVARLLAHAGGRLDDDLALVLAASLADPQDHLNRRASGRGRPALC
jgi:sigma-B regulation protein RsbU (phosphoserine phosphatase)